MRGSGPAPLSSARGRAAVPVCWPVDQSSGTGSHPSPGRGRLWWETEPGQRTIINWGGRRIWGGTLTTVNIPTRWIYDEKTHGSPAICIFPSALGGSGGGASVGKQSQEVGAKAPARLAAARVANGPQHGARPAEEVEA